MKKENFEKQNILIKEKDKTNLSLENKIAKLINENERIILINNTLIKELENMKETYDKFKFKAEKHAEDIKASFEEQLS